MSNLLNRFIVLVLFIVIILLADRSNIFAFQLPDTGQNECYSSSAEIPCFMTDQDGVYNINPLSYTDNEDGTVTDNNTGLMWQKKDDGKTYNWYQAYGKYASVYNPTTQNVCKELTTGGYTDWRLPTKKELIGIVDYSVPSPGPVINSIFESTAQSGYWTSTTYTPELYGCKWRVDFSSGNFWGGSNCIDAYYVRCVRDGKPIGQSFKDNNDGTVIDNNTGLIWQKEDDGNVYSWYNASSTVCSELTIGGYSDWRLPNSKELMSIVDYTVPSPAINPVFENTKASNYWSSTTIANSSSNPWCVNFNFGSLIYGNVYTDSFYVRCVRGSSNEVFLDNGDRTVTDNRSELMWQKDSHEPITWLNALSYCNLLSLGEHDDWRLPNIKELESITDDTIYDPAIDTAFFIDAAQSIYWSSTTYVTTPYYTWSVFLGEGNAILETKYSWDINRVRCVRGGKSASIPSVLLGPIASDLEYSSFVDSQFTITSIFNDNLKAITSCDYSLNNGSDWTSANLIGSGATTQCQTTTASCANGQTLKIQMKAINAIGTSSTDSITRICDLSVPTTTDNQTNSNWQNTEKTITLTPNDGNSSGVIASTGIYGCLGTECTPVLLGGNTLTTNCGDGYECSHDVRYYSKDNVGNTEPIKTSIFQARIDRKAPTISSTTPDNNATGAVLNSIVTISWSENIDCTSVTTSTVTINPSVGWSRISCSGNSAFFTPTGQTNSTQYTVTVGTGSKDLIGNPMASPYQFYYITADAPINGRCGTSHRGIFTSEPSTNLCNYTASTPTVAPTSIGWVWACTGSNGGSDTGCSATKELSSFTDPFNNYSYTDNWDVSKSGLVTMTEGNAILSVVITKPLTDCSYADLTSKETFDGENLLVETGVSLKGNGEMLLRLKKDDNNFVQFGIKQFGPDGIPDFIIGSSENGTYTEQALNLLTEYSVRKKYKFKTFSVVKIGDEYRAYLYGMETGGVVTNPLLGDEGLKVELRNEACSTELKGVKNSFDYVFVSETIDGNIPAEDLKLLTPDGGEAIKTGSTYLLLWESPEGASYYSIDYSTDGGIKWRLLDTAIESRFYTWKLSKKKPLNTYKLRVKSHDSLGTIIDSDASDSTFTVQY